MGVQGGVARVEAASLCRVVFRVLTRLGGENLGEVLRGGRMKIRNMISGVRRQCSSRLNKTRFCARSKHRSRQPPVSTRCSSQAGQHYQADNLGVCLKTPPGPPQPLTAELVLCYLHGKHTENSAHLWMEALHCSSCSSPRLSRCHPSCTVRSFNAAELPSPLVTAAAASGGPPGPAPTS